MPVSGYEGFAALGELLGGKVGKPGVYEDTLKKAYSADEQLQQAGKARTQKLLADEQLASRRGGFEQSLIAAGFDPKQAAIAAQIGRMNQTFNASQAGDFLRPGYLEAASGARDAALGTAPPPLGQVDGEAEMYAQSLGLPPPDPVVAAPDVPTYNRLNAFLQGKSYQPTQVLGGAYVADGVTLDDLDMVPTLGTLATMEQKQAAIDQGQQRTNAAVAKANRAPAPKASGKVTTASSEAAELRQAREAVQAGADPAQVADLLRKRGFPALAKKVYAGN